MWQKLLCLGLAGAAGTLARYALAGLTQRAAGDAFPWGTLAVNVAGCFMAGLVWALCEERIAVSGETRTVIFVGFMGAFTTFSAYVLETSALLRDGQWAWAMGNMALQNVAGVALFFLGMAAGRFV